MYEKSANATNLNKKRAEESKEVEKTLKITKDVKNLKVSNKLTELKKVRKKFMLRF